jgi:TRAP-type mannitol/chloroaromatic compound transport system permease large subunit
VSLLFFWFFVILMAMGVPVVFAMFLAPGISLLIDGKTTFYTLLMQRMYNGIDSFPLMAIPFFILAGEMMNHGGITLSLVRFSQSVIGHVRP